MPKNIILPSKKTDLCELCLIGKKKENIQNPSEEEKKLLLVYKNHLSNAVAQRICFKNDILNLREKQAIIVMDFKQNIKLGGNFLLQGPEEVSYDFYQCFLKPSPSLLPFRFYLFAFIRFYFIPLTHSYLFNSIQFFILLFWFILISKSFWKLF